MTEQRENEERLEAATAEVERERQTLEAIFETVSVGLLLIGPDGRYDRMNKRPVPRGPRRRGGPARARLLPGRQDDDVARADAVLPRRAGGGVRRLQPLVGADSATRLAFSTSARQVRGPSGERLGAALAYQEITDLMRAIQVKTSSSRRCPTSSGRR